MKILDFYRTIDGPKRTETKVKGSKFIASAAPINNKEDAMRFLENIKSEFYDASHNCFAYCFGAESLEYRASDDGEPNGTAGKPILFSIKKSQFSDIIVVVTRYFGGTKLGTGGLAKAYSDAANQVLEMCEAKIINITRKVEVFCTYQDVSTIKRLLSEYSVSFSENYADACEFEVYIHKSKAIEFAEKVISNTNARAGYRFIN